MEKTILIGDKEVKMKYTGSLIWIYRTNFKSDFLKDLITMQKDLEKGNNDISNVNMEVFEKIAWCMAKSADSSIPEIEKWLDQFGMFDIMLALPEIMTLISDNMEQLNNSKIEINANTIILRCLQLGLSLSDFDKLSIGFLLDLVEENNRERRQSEEPIEADSEMIHRFFK